MSSSEYELKKVGGMAYSHELLLEALRKAGNQELHLKNLKGAWIYHIRRKDSNAPEARQTLETGPKSVDELIEALSHDVDSMIGFQRGINAISRIQTGEPRKGRKISSSDLILSLMATKKLLKRLKARGELT